MPDQSRSESSDTSSFLQNETKIRPALGILEGDSAITQPFLGRL